MWRVRPPHGLPISPAKREATRQVGPAKPDAVPGGSVRMRRCRDLIRPAKTPHRDVSERPPATGFVHPGQGFGRERLGRGNPKAAIGADDQDGGQIHWLLAFTKRAPMAC